MTSYNTRKQDGALNLHDKSDTAAANGTHTGNTVPPPVQRLRTLGYVLARTRFSVIVLIAGLVLLLTDQGSDMLINTVQNGKTWQFSFALMFWGLSIWGWARFLLDIRFPDPPTYQAYFNFWRKWIPRALGGLAFVVVGFSAWQASDKTHQLTWLSAVGLVIFIVIVIVRHIQAGRKGLRTVFHELG